MPPKCMRNPNMQLQRRQQQQSAPNATANGKMVLLRQSEWRNGTRFTCDLKYVA